MTLVKNLARPVLTGVKAAGQAATHVPTPPQARPGNLASFAGRAASAPAKAPPRAPNQWLRQAGKLAGGAVESAATDAAMDALDLEAPTTRPSAAAAFGSTALKMASSPPPSPTIARPGILDHLNRNPPDLGRSPFE